MCVCVCVCVRVCVSEYLTTVSAPAVLYTLSLDAVLMKLLVMIYAWNSTSQLHLPHFSFFLKKKKYGGDLGGLILAHCWLAFSFITTQVVRFCTCAFFVWQFCVVCYIWATSFYVLLSTVSSPWYRRNYCATPLVHLSHFTAFMHSYFAFASVWYITRSVRFSSVVLQNFLPQSA